MTTNASLIDDEIIEVMKKDFELRVSIDGNRKTHLINRISKNGMEYFETIIRNIDKLKKTIYHLQLDDSNQ